MNKVFRTIQDLIDKLEEHGYSYSRTAGSHQIYSALGKRNVVLVVHNNARSTRAHPKAIRTVLQAIS